MANQLALQAALSDFATRLVDRYDLDEVLHDLSDRAVAVLELDGAGLTIGPEPAAGRMNFVTATDESATRVERAQDKYREGVCFSAAAEGKVLLVSALEANDNRWPRYTPVALEEGFRAVAGIPMAIEGEMIGVLNAYRRAPGPWTEEDVAAGELLAKMATAYLTNATQLGEARKLAEQLQQALDSRIVIEQAKGMLGERLRVTPDVAFKLLRAYARQHRRPLRNVAQQVLTGNVQIGAQN